jgi:DNA-binding transcriptional ArsR family regulator
MRQLVLPMIPKGATQISNLISVWRDDQRWTYFYGTHPIYYHESKDHRMLRVVTSQLIESGACRPVDIIKTFGVSKSSVDRALKKLRTGGIEAFFKKREGKKCGTVLTKDLLEKAQSRMTKGTAEEKYPRKLA